MAYSRDLSHRDSSEKPTRHSVLRIPLAFGILLLAILSISSIRAESDFSRLSSYLAHSVGDGTVAGGSILLIHRGEIVLKEGFGCADIETNTPFLADTPVLVDELTKPLGMKRTFYRDETALAKIGEMPTRYYHGKNGQLLVTKKRRLAQKNTYSSSGGSVISTAPDLARWLMTIRNGGRHEGTSYLSPEMFARMISSHPRSRCLHSSMCVLSRSLHPR